jgi:hypothetical protein
MLAPKKLSLTLLLRYWPKAYLGVSLLPLLPLCIGDLARDADRGAAASQASYVNVALVSRNEVPRFRDA